MTQTDKRSVCSYTAVQIRGWMFPDTYLAEPLLPESLGGPWEGQNVSDLVDSIESGQAYVDVHTETNIGGEIRGTIEQAPAAAAGDEGGADDENGG